MGVLVVGHITKDIIKRDDNLFESPGGVVYYFSLVARRLGLDVDVLTKLNPKDIHLLNELRKEGINIIWKESKETTVFENIYHEDIDKRKQKVLSIADPIGVQDFPNKEYKLIHFGPLVHSDIPTDIYQRVRKLYKQTIISLDIQGHMRFVEGDKIVLKKIDIDFLSYIDVLKLNEKEIYTLTGYKEYIEALKILGEYTNEIVLTLGSKGSIIYYNGDIFEIPVFKPRKIVDVTGCGDTYMATYLFMRLKGFHPQSSGIFASFLAGLKVESVGINIPKITLE
ncbi:MAG TPA: ribokinase [Candidatus Nanopusillus sp.]|nr:ribokinase [Candidatus Nanopusillus sp.]